MPDKDYQSKRDAVIGQVESDGWHIGDGIDDCSGYDDIEQDESIKKIEKAIDQLVAEERIKEREKLLDELHLRLYIPKEDEIWRYSGDLRGRIEQAVEIAEWIASQRNKPSGGEMK